MIVAGDLVQAEQRLAIRAPLSLLQTALMRQKGRALHEEQGKRRHVRHRIAHITSLPQVRQRVAAPAQCPNEAIQDFHASRETRFPSLRESPKRVPEPFFHRTPRPGGSVATQCQSDLELLECRAGP